MKRIAKTGWRRNVAVTTCVIGATFMAGARPTAGQEMMMQAPDDRVPFLAAGGVMVLFRANDAGEVYVATVEALAPGSDPTSIPVRQGDILVRFADVADPDLEAVRDGVSAVGMGETVTLDVRRGSATHRLELTKASPDGVPGAVMVPEGAAGEASGGMWMSAGGEDGRLELEIAGNQIRADEETGAPRVMFKRRHPRMAEVGLAALDIVTAVNGSRVETMEELLAAYQAVPRGGQVELTVIRDGAEREIRFEKPTPEGR